MMSYKRSIFIAVFAACSVAVLASNVLAAEIMPSYATLPTGWVVDRYEPVSFTNVGPFQGRPDVLGISIGPSTDSANRGGQSGTFCNTQGRQFTFSLPQGPGSMLSSVLYIPAAWANQASGAVRTDMWGVMVDGSNAVTAYPVIGFTNYGGIARLRVYNVDTGLWTDLPGPVNYDAWTRLSIELTPTTLNYYVNGVLVNTQTDINGSVAFGATIMQAYNFADPAIAPPALSTAAYTAHWSNIALTSIVDDDSVCPGASYTTIGAAITAAASGDTISVCPGTYNESPTITKSLTVQSTGGREVTTIQLPPSNAPGVGYLGSVYINSPTADVVIDGFTIIGNDAANPVLANSNVVSQASNSLNVTNSRLKVGARDGGTNNDDGIGVLTTFSIGAGAVSVTNNEFMPVNAEGARAFYINPGTGTTFNFQNNQVTGHFTKNAATECGGLISGNKFTGTGASGGFGAYNFGGPACGDPGTYTNNSVTGATTGMYITGANGVVLTGNSFTDNVTGIFITDVDVTGTVAHFNRIANNSSAGIENATASVVDAENNWWGCNYGPGVGGTGCAGTANGITGAGAANVDADPWLRLTTSAATPTVIVGGTDVVSSLLTTNSDNNTPGGGFIWNGTPATFVGTNGAVAPPSSTTTSGATGTIFTGTVPGVGGVATTVDGQTVSAPIVVYPASCAAVSMPTSTTLTGASIVVPINTDEMTARGAIALDTTITYNTSVLTFTGAALGTVGTNNIPNGPRLLSVTENVLGTLVISVLGADEFQGSGPLVNLNFNVTGLPATSSAMVFSSFTYNEGTPCSTRTNGLVTVLSGTITGEVTYGNAIVGGGPSPRHVPGTTLNAVGSINQSAVTALDGTYTLSGMGAGPYVVTPVKTGDDQGALTGFDSACIAQYVVSLAGGCMTSPSPTVAQTTVADVSGNLTITSFDAALIARYAASLPGFGNTGQWRFTPTSISYPDVNTNYINQNYVALLMGDVTGNWKNLLATRPAPIFPEGERPMRISAPSISAPVGTEVSIPVDIQDTTGKGILSYEFDLRFDPRVLEPAANTVDLVGTIGEGQSVTVNSLERGKIRVVVYGTNALMGAGHLLNLKFNVIGDVNEASDLTWESFNINEGGINFEVMNGRVAVREASNGAAIAGRVLTAIGLPVSGATVTLVDTNGQTRTTRASSFGNFRFDELTVGQTYTISVSAKRSTFASQTVSVTDDAVNLDMIAEQ